MKKILLLSAILSLSLFSQSAFADEANIGGTGAMLEVLNSSEIEMSDEVITIDLYPENSEEENEDKQNGYAEIKVLYTFKNTTNEKVNVQMGFPEQCEYGDCGTNIYNEKIQDFKIFENFQEIPVEYKKSEVEASEENDWKTSNWYISELTFEPNEKKSIQNTYWIIPSMYKAGSRWINYTLETGASWKNSIGTVDIYVTMHDGLSIYDVSEINLEGYKFNREENRIEWNLEDLEPGEDENLSVSYTDNTVPDPLRNMYCLETPEVEELYRVYSHFKENDGYGGSSFLKADEKYSYYPCLTQDNDPTTAWVEGKDDDGKGEWIELDQGQSEVFYGIRIFNGYGSDKDTWQKNNRVKKAKITFEKNLAVPPAEEEINDEAFIQHTEILNFEDTFGYQDIYFTQPVARGGDPSSDGGAAFISLEILETYAGSKFNDTAISEVRLLGLIKPETLSNAAFSDTINNIYNDAIGYLKENKIVQGYENGTFKPDNQINRAELTKIIIEAKYGSTTVGENCFPDVQKEWFAKYVCFAKEKGIINGYPDGKFHPADNINYVEALKIALEAFGYGSTEKSDPWYKFYIDKSIELSVNVAETTNDEKISRGKMAQLIANILKH